MRKLNLALVWPAVLLSWGMAFGQQIPTPYQSSFSSAGAGTVQFDFDLSDSALASPTNTHQVIYRDQPATVWNSAPVTLLYQTCSTYTFSGQITYTPPSGLLEWYFRSENDSAVVSQSPKNAGDAFPPPLYLMADMGADSVGDAQSAAGTWLDITHAYASYSGTKLYFRLVNNGGGFPTNQGLFTYFIYSVGIVDPNASDSAAYALVYANVPALLSPGLYRINAVDSSFTNIGSITTNISGNALSLSCNIADLSAQPGWSDWPPPAGFIGIAPVTATQNLTQLTPNDIGKTGVFAPKSRMLNFALNTPPTLSNGQAFQLGQNSAVAEVVFSDADSNLAVQRNLLWEATAYPMSACEKSYAAGALFQYRFAPADSGWYHYHFEFSDGAATATTPLDSVYLAIPLYICGDANHDRRVNVADAVYIINFVFVPGSPSPCVNCP